MSSSNYSATVMRVALSLPTARTLLSSHQVHREANTSSVSAPGHEVQARDIQCSLSVARTHTHTHTYTYHFLNSCTPIYYLQHKFPILIKWHTCVWCVHDEHQLEHTSLVSVQKIVKSLLQNLRVFL
jgi:hypothetical protein